MKESSVAREVLDRWEQAGVKHCHWKSTWHLEEALQGHTDLDVLVEVEQAGLAEREARAAGFVRAQTARLRAYPGVIDYLAYDPAVDRVVYLHLHYQLVLGDRWVKAYRVPEERGLLQRRVWADQERTWVVSPGDELVIFVARMCVKHRRPFRKAGVSAEAEYLKGRVRGDDVPSAFDTAYPSACIRLSRQILDSEVESVSGRSIWTARRAMRGLMRVPRWRFGALSTVRAAYRYVIEANRRIFADHRFGRRRLQPTGMMVAFVGLDGAGKSSAVARLGSEFAKELDVDTVFCGTGRSGAPWYRRAIFGLLGTRASLQGHRNVKVQHDTESPGKRAKPPLYYLLWVWLCARDRDRRILQAFRSRTNGRVVLADRWPQESIEGRFDGPKLRDDSGNDGIVARRARAAEERAFQRARTTPPDLIVRLRIPPQTSVDRKPGELLADEASRWSDEFELVTWPAESTVLTVDGGLPRERVDAVVKEAVWDHLRTRSG